MVSKLVPFCGGGQEGSAAVFCSLVFFFFFSFDDYKPKHWNDQNCLLDGEG